MACECGCSTEAPRPDVAQETQSGCGCSTGGSGNDLDVGSLARLVKDLDQRVRQLELETSRN